MRSSRKQFLALPMIIGVGICFALLTYLGQAVNAAPEPLLSPNDEYVLLSWNDLGMHCYNRDFADLAVLPPYNNLWAQVVLRGDPPVIVTSGITVTYGFSNNTYSVGKSNFWTYAQQLFGLLNPLPPNIGLTGNGLCWQYGPWLATISMPTVFHLRSSATAHRPRQIHTSWRPCA